MIERDINHEPNWLLSIVVPTYNEETILLEFHRRLTTALCNVSSNYEIIFVNDGSTDNTSQTLHELRQYDPSIAEAKLTRNFGKEQAISAGVHLAQGDAVIIIDPDLQDPPELIESMVAAWKEGAEVVNMRRNSRGGESNLKKIAARLFYKIINALGEVKLIEDVSDLRLLDRRAINAVNQLTETTRFMNGLFVWIGFRQITLEYDRDVRVDGKSKWNYWKLWNFALDGITSFSIIPLKIATYTGLLSSLGSFAYAFYFGVKALLLGDPVVGFPTLICFVLLIGGIQLMTIGIIGEYIGRMYIEGKRRPLYLLDYYHSRLTKNNEPTN